MKPRHGWARLSGARLARLVALRVAGKAKHGKAGLSEVEPHWPSSAGRPMWRGKVQDPVAWQGAKEGEGWGGGAEAANLVFFCHLKADVPHNSPAASGQKGPGRCSSELGTASKACTWVRS